MLALRDGHDVEARWRRWPDGRRSSAWRWPPRPVPAAQYVWDEIAGPDSVADDRWALLALAILGTADARSLSALCGQPVDVDHIAATIPLVVDTGDGRVRAHDLWLRDAGVDAARPTRCGRWAGTPSSCCSPDGANVRAGSLAARIGDHDALGRAALLLVRDTISALPVDTADGWLRAAPASNGGGRSFNCWRRR